MTNDICPICGEPLVTVCRRELVNMTYQYKRQIAKLEDDVDWVMADLYNVITPADSRMPTYAQDGKIFRFTGAKYVSFGEGYATNLTATADHENLRGRGDGHSLRPECNDEEKQ